MFGRRATLVAINKCLDAYQQNESLPPKLFKAFSSTFLKSVKKIEAEVAAKLEEGNPDDHARHEEYMLSFLPDNLRVQIYAHVNRGIANANTLMALKKIMADDTWEDLVESLEQVVKVLYVQPNNCIFDPNDAASEKWAGLIFLRHGEGYYVENGAHHNFMFLDCIDLLGVTDHAFYNGTEIANERVQIVSRSACLVGIVTFVQLIDTVKALDTTEQEINDVVAFLLARSVRLAKERERKQQEEEMKRQETLRRHLAEWREYLKSGDLENVSRYVVGGFDINSDIGVLRDKPLIIAMTSKSVELVHYLCDHGADVNGVNENGSTALHVCCQIGWLDGINQLLGRGARILPDKQGNTPLHIAAQQGNREVIELFIRLKAEGRQGIDWSLKNNEGEKVVDCCMDLELRKVIVPKGVVGYSFDRWCVCS